MSTKLRDILAVVVTIADADHRVLGQAAADAQGLVGVGVDRQARVADEGGQRCVVLGTWGALVVAR